MTGTLILPDWLIDIPGSPPKRGWGVRVVGPQVEAVAPHDELRRQHPDDEVWEAPGQALAVGADADVVIFDPEREAVLTHAGAPRIGGAAHVHHLHENCDYTPYEGLRLRGWPALTMLRGQVIARDGEFVGQQGHGRFLSRQGQIASGA